MMLIGVHIPLEMLLCLFCLMLGFFLGSIELMLGFFLGSIELMLTPMKHTGKKAANPGSMLVC